MKLKHRKLILIISLSAMGVGLISVGIASSKKENNKSIESMESIITPIVTVTPTEELTVTPSPENDTQAQNDETTKAENPTDVPTDTPTPTSVPLEEDKNSDVNKLISKYLQAKLDGKKKKLKQMVTDPTCINIEEIQKKTEFIEAYDNIKVYTKKATGDIDYIAYVYMEVKIASIDTKAPALDEYYIKKVDGEYKIVLGNISDETAEYIAQERESEDVMNLLESVNKKLKKAKKKDKQLSKFCSKLDSSIDE